MGNQYSTKEGMEKYLKARVGKRFGKLITLKRVGTNKQGNPLWKCKCDCGKFPVIAMGNLIRGHTKSCGCLVKERTIDLRGKKIGRWKVLDKPHTPSNRGAYWKCRCDCGVVKKVSGLYLRNGMSRSCGCSTRLPEGESSFRWLYKKYEKANAKARGHKFRLTPAQFRKLTKKKCYYCGAKPNNKVKRSKRMFKGKLVKSCNGDYIYNGLDRKENTKGYTKENCVPSCFSCNGMKSRLSQREFWNNIKRIYLHRTRFSKKK